MAFKVVILAALVAVANAGYLGGYAAPAVAYGGYGAVAPAAITSQQSNILRSYGNLGQVSTYSKTIDTPYSSVSKSDIRVTNDALGYAPAYGGYAARAGYGYAAAPALAYGGYARSAYAAPALAYGGLARSAYAAPALAYGGLAHAAPALSYGGYAARAVAAPAVAGLGVAYSAAPAVAHLSYTGLGASYGW